jgi:hypothetical protein
MIRPSVRALGKIVQRRSSTCPRRLDHDTDSITASHLHSFDRPHNVSRCITRRVAAIDGRRPSRGPPQCLDHVRGHGRSKGQGCTGFVQGIRRSHQGQQLCELCRVQGRRCSQCDQGTGGRHDGNRARSVQREEEGVAMGVRQVFAGRRGCERGGNHELGTQWHVWRAWWSCPAQLELKRGPRPRAPRLVQHHDTNINRAKC